MFRTKLYCHTEKIARVHAVPVEQYLESSSVKAVALFLVAVICSCLTGKPARTLSLESVETPITMFFSHDIFSPYSDCYLFLLDWKIRNKSELRKLEVLRHLSP